MEGQPTNTAHHREVCASRIRAVNSQGVNVQGRCVVYWMIAQRRLKYNFALQRAIEWANRLGKPLLIVEALNLRYPHASDRIHRFIMDGMAENQRQCQSSRATYLSLVERSPKAARGILRSLGEMAALVVTDSFPCFELPKWVEAAGEQSAVRLESVDGNGLVPLTESPKAFTTAYAFRRWLQGNLHTFIDDFPVPAPLELLGNHGSLTLPAGFKQRWQFMSAQELSFDLAFEQSLAIDHSVGRVISLRGGSGAAEQSWGKFLREGLAGYGDRRNHPAYEQTSSLSPYLHFGHISSHQVFADVAAQNRWSKSQLLKAGRGSREGWWQMDADAQAFLDQLITWRELGYVFCHHREDYAELSSLPDWALKTLDIHSGDPRAHLYSLETLEGAETHDDIWNAAQRQLVQTGQMHNYLRMLWGKKILQWTPDAQSALEIMVHLNNKYALDGRNPNSYSGIFWVLGRFDRAWGPERPIFGKIRYMTSEQARKKLKWGDYLERYAAPQGQLNFGF